MKGAWGDKDADALMAGYAEGRTRKALRGLLDAVAFKGVSTHKDSFNYYEARVPAELVEQAERALGMKQEAPRPACIRLSEARGPVPFQPGACNRGHVGCGEPLDVADLRREAEILKDANPCQGPKTATAAEVAKKPYPAWERGPFRDLLTAVQALSSFHLAPAQFQAVVDALAPRVRR